MSRVIVLTDAECSYLVDIIDLWVEGHEEATEMTMDDRSIGSPDQLNQLVAGLDEQKAIAQEIRGRLTT